MPLLSKGEIINGDRYLDGAFIDNIPAYPLLDKDLDYILCVYFDNHKYFFETADFDKKIIKFFDFPNQRRLETLGFNPSRFDEMVQYGYDYALNTLRELFKNPEKDAVMAAIFEREKQMDREYKPRLTVDVVLNNINVMTKKYIKRMTNIAKAD